MKRVRIILPEVEGRSKRCIYRKGGVLQGHGKVRKRIKDLKLGEHHSFALKQIMQHIEVLDQAIDELGQQIEVVTRPFAHQLENVQTIPGIQRKGAGLILAEVGTDMARFPMRDIWPPGPGCALETTRVGETQEW